MKIVVFGATGQIGPHLVEQALERGYEVRAFVRDASKLSHLQGKAEIVEGDVFNENSVSEAVKDCDAVLCSLGDGASGKVRAEGTRKIVEAMTLHGVKRLICQTTLGAGNSAQNLNFFWKYIMFGLFLRDALADHEEQENVVHASPVDWTIVRPAAFTKGQKSGNYRFGFSPTDRALTLKISCADVADFMLRQLADRSFLRRTVGLSY